VRGIALSGALAGVALACAPIATAGPGCAPTGAAVLLPAELQESSGVAVSRTSPGVLWTHIDEGATLFAIDAQGAVLARFGVDARTRDPEDLAAGACADGGACLYLADTGDNGEQRQDARIVRVREPTSLAAPGTLPADVFPVRLPDGPRDIEAIFVLPGERVYLVTKGRAHAVTVYRYPGALRPEAVTLEEVQRLTDGPRSLLDQVTGASASADGTLVAVRTYQALSFYRVVEGRLVLMERGLVNLRSLEEVQGEGVGLGAGGAVWLTAEGGPLGGPAALRALSCRV
jgi:hypothetical protein